MPSWTHLGHNYLLHCHITPPENLEQTIDSMILQESAAYFQSLGLDKKIDDIVEAVMIHLRKEYRLSIPAKPSMLSLLQYLSQKTDSTLCVLTTSENNCAIPALDRNHMLSYFKDIHTSEELGLSKCTAKICQTVCDRYQIAPSETVVFENALYAILAAKEAGCYIYAVPDDPSISDWDIISSIADEIFQP